MCGPDLNPEWTTQDTEVVECDRCGKVKHCLYLDDPATMEDEEPSKAWFCESCYRQLEGKYSESGEDD